MHLSVLGPLTLTDEEGAPQPLSPRDRRVLEVLAAAAPRAVSTAELVAALYPEDAPASAANQVQGCVSRIRRLAGPGEQPPIEYASRAYRLSDAVHLDLTSFQDHAAQGLRAAAAGDTGQALAHLGAALDLWRGDPFATSPQGTPGAGLAASLVSTWVDVALNYWQLQALTHPAQAVSELEGLVAQHPLRENVWAALMKTLAASGRRAEALDVFVRLRRTMRERLGVQPSADLVRLNEQLLHDDPPPARADRPTGHLPPAAPLFVGREDLLHRIAYALEVPGSTVVLHGRHGIGKSALAVEAAHAAIPTHPDGVFHVNAHSGGDHQLDAEDVLADLLEQAGVSRHALPDGLEARRAAWAERLRGRRALVVLEEVPGPALAQAVLPPRSCSTLVTCHRALTELPGTENIGVGPFTPAESLEMLRRLVGPHRLMGQDERLLAVAEACGHHPTALHLVASRLRAHPGADLSGLLGQLSRTEWVLPRLAERGLDLNAGIETMLEVLPESARQAFDLAPLLGDRAFPGWALGALVGQRDWYGIVDDLVEAHLVVEEGVDTLGQPRYALQTLTREVAHARSQRLAPSTMREATARLVRTWWSLAQRAAGSLPPTLHDPLLLDPDLQVPACPAWVDGVTLRTVADARAWLRVERHSLVHAVEVAAAQGQGYLAGQLTNALLPYYDYAWLHDDWEHTTRAALEALQDPEGTQRGEPACAAVTADDGLPAASDAEERTLALVHARMLRARAHVALYRGRHEAGESLALEALECFEALGDARGVALTHLVLVTAIRELKRPLDALAHGRAALSSDVPRIRAAAHSVTAGLLLAGGQPSEAFDAYQAAVAEAARGQDDHRLGLAVRGRGRALAALGDVDSALADLRRSVSLLQEINDPGCAAQSLQALAGLYERQGRDEEAAEARAAFEQFYESVGRPGTRGPYDATAPRSRERTAPRA